MRVVLDTNILVSALIAPAGNPAAIYNAWEQGKFTLLTCAEHLDELRATLQKPRVSDLIRPYKAGRLVNQIKKLAQNIGHLPHVKRSPDPGDNFLLALAEAGNADYLVTGDKSGPAGARQSQVHSDHHRARLRRPVRGTGSMNRGFPLLAILATRLSRAKPSGHFSHFSLNPLAAISARRG